MTNKFKTAGFVPSFILLLLSVLLLLLLPMEVDETNDVYALAFFRATEDKENIELRRELTNQNLFATRCADSST